MLKYTQCPLAFIGKRRGNILQRIADAIRPTQPDEFKCVASLSDNRQLANWYPAVLPKVQKKER